MKAELPTPQDEKPLLALHNVTKTFGAMNWFGMSAKTAVTAVDGVSFVLRRGETLGLVGETGSGKSTIGRVILRLEDPTSGAINFKNEDIAKLNRQAVRRRRRDMQMVFQDPYGSLDPRMTVGDLISEPMIVHGVPRSEIAGRMGRILDQVGLARDMAERYPHEFSGGQRQRIGVARALVLEPDLLILDEPVSALDVSIQAQILNMLRRIQRETRISYLFIAHDLAVVRHISDRIAVLYLGRIVETAPRDRLYAAPRHPYTVSLLSAVPVPNPDLERARNRVELHGEISSGTAIPSGCRFHPRCFRARLVAAAGNETVVRAAVGTVPRKCADADPALSTVADVSGHEVACHFPLTEDELPNVMGAMVTA
ncbi:MAG: ABC transporter ATP-binding protein [Hyphomicrobiaceae bacterium]